MMTGVLRRTTLALPALTLIAIVLLGTTACAPRAMRGGEGTENPNMDQAAMSTTLDKEDVRFLALGNLDALYASRWWMQSVEAASSQPVVAIWPIQNATTEHLDDQMLTLLSSIETSLVNTGDVRVVSRESQAALAREIGVQQGAAYDPRHAARMGRQLGARYFVTGKLTSVDERIQRKRRVQYTLFVQVLDIETGQVLFQNEMSRSKALQR